MLKVEALRPSALYPLFFESLQQPQKMDHLIHILYVRKLAPKCELGQHSSCEVDLCLEWGCLSVRWELLTMSSLSASDKSGCGLQAPSLFRSAEASNGREVSVSRLLCGRSSEDLLTGFCKVEGTAPGGANRYPTCCRWAQMGLFGQHPIVRGSCCYWGIFSPVHFLISALLRAFSQLLHTCMLAV